MSFPRGPARKDFVVRVLGVESRGGSLTFEEILAFDALSRSGRASGGEIASRLQSSEERAEDVLAGLVRRGCVESSGAGRRRTYVVAGAPGSEKPLGKGSSAPGIERRVLEAARAGSVLTRRQVASDLGISSDQAKRLLERLARSGALVRTGRGRAVSYRGRPILSGAPASESGAPKSARRARKAPGRRIGR